MKIGKILSLYLQRPYNKLYKLSKKGARLQTGDMSGAQQVFTLIDKEVEKLYSMGKLFILYIQGEEYNLPVCFNSVVYFRPFFAMATHKKLPAVQADDTHAVDFDVPLGSEVFAVESGVITALEHTKTAGGNDPSFSGMDNYLYIYNKEKNLMFCYRHLAPFSHLTRHQYVEKGTSLGKVGKTGYVITPHLHFAVYRYNPGEKIILKSLRIRFK